MDDAQYAANELNVDTRVVHIARLLVGMNVETEHGVRHHDGRFNVTGGDVVRTAQIALAHFYENPGNPTAGIPDYYTLLERMENSADAEWDHFGTDKPAIFKNP